MPRQKLLLGRRVTGGSSSEILEFKNKVTFLHSLERTWVGRWLISNLGMCPLPKRIQFSIDEALHQNLQTSKTIRPRLKQVLSSISPSAVRSGIVSAAGIPALGVSAKEVHRKLILEEQRSRGFQRDAGST